VGDVSFLSQINPFQSLPTDFLKIHFDVIFPSTLRSFKLSCAQVSPSEVRVLSPLPYMPYNPHISFFLIGAAQYDGRTEYTDTPL
jgi:hypothetical protein